MKHTFKSVRKLFLTAALCAGLFLSLTAKADVWETENQWSPAFEEQYQQWLVHNVDTKIFSKKVLADGTPNPYYGIHVDCADLVYSLRTIFSFENKLPFAISNTVTSGGPLISNSVKRYDNLPAGHARVRAFLQWIYGIVSTRGLPNDTYSIPFNAVGRGTIILTSKANHHSWTIRDISAAGNPDLIFNSTVGAHSGTDVQERSSWPNPSWIFAADGSSTPVYSPGSYAGFRAWRPAAYLNKPEASVPGYSQEQHTVGLSKWKAIAQKQLASVGESVDQIVSRLLKDACADFQQRVEAVAEAEAYKKSAGLGSAAGEAQCMNAESFDEYSTPSRDRRFVDGLMQARAYFQKAMKTTGPQAFTPENLKIYQTMFSFIDHSAADEMKLDKIEKSNQEYCSLKINEAYGKMSLAELKRRLFLGTVSANPNDSTSGRFGFAKTSKDIAYTTCKNKTYGLKPSVYDLDAIEKDAQKEVAAH